MVTETLYVNTIWVDNIRTYSVKLVIYLYLSILLLHHEGFKSIYIYS